MGKKKSDQNRMANAMMAIAVVVVIAGIIAGLNYLGVSFGQATVVDPITGQTVTDTTGAPLEGCNVAPTVAESAVDAQNEGTAVSPDYQYRVNGEFFSSVPTLSFGDKVQVIANLSSYIDEVSDVKTITCGANPVIFKLADYSAPTVEIKEDSTILTDSATGGASNSTSIPAGGSENYEICFTGTDKDSTGDFEFIIELSENANVSVVTMSGLTGSTSDIPGFYTDTLTSPYAVKFDVPSIDKASEKCYSTTFQAKTGKTIRGAVYTTAYVKQAFVESDGTFVASGIENKDNTVKYEATFDEDFFITNP